MKKVLFATTALVATAGVASADIALSGSAEMGVIGGDDTTAQFLQSIDIDFTGTGTADNGLTFGASIDLADVADSGDIDDSTDPDYTVFVSGDFGTLTMGDTDGALDWALTEVNIGSPGSIADDETGHAGYNGNSGLDGWFDGQVLRYDYSFGDFGIALSVEQDDDSNGYGGGYFFGDVFDIIEAAAPAGFVLNDPDETADPIWGIGATYDGMFAGGSYGIGIGYQFTNDGLGVSGVSGVEAHVLGMSASVALDSGFSAAVNYSMIGFGTEEALAEINTAFGTALPEEDVEGTHVGIGASYTFDAITVHANYGQYDWDDSFEVFDASGYGLAASYDFGGGLSAHVAYGFSDYEDDAVDNDSTWSLGMAMSF